MSITPKGYRAKVQNALDALLSTRLAVDCQNPIVTLGANGFSRISWPANAGTEDDGLFYEDFNVVKTYFGWLSSRQYSAVLFDGSLLQITFDLRGNRLVGHRLAYIPCPFDIAEEDRQLLHVEPILDVIGLYRQNGDDCFRLRTPVRFDYDPHAATSEHPASHMTLNGHECRIPLSGPLTLDQFLEFVFRHFYPSILRDNDFLLDGDSGRWPRHILEPHEYWLHVNWRSGAALSGISQEAS